MGENLATKVGVSDDTVPTKRKQRKKVQSKIVFAWIFALMPLLGFILFSLFPIMVALVAAFVDMDIYTMDQISWNSFEGFRLVFDAEYSAAQTVDVHAMFIHSIWITLWIGSTFFVTLLVALIISVCLAQVTRGSKILQVLYFLPNVIASVAIAIMWRWIFDKDNGLLNSVLGLSVDWLDTSNTIPWTVIIAILWSAPAYGIVMFKAALTNTDKSLYEAADLDGANMWNKTIHITLPSIAPTTFYLLMSSVGASLLVYDIAALIIPTGFGNGAVGGRDNMALTVMRLIYFLMDDKTLADRYSYMSAAAIISWLLFFVTATFSILIYKIRQRRMEDA